MNIPLENFKPKLKPGRMIPHGSKFTFKMDEPYDKITMPMIMADFILLCGGKYTVRQIAEKIYRKQGSVPFRAILETLYELHTRGFLENSNELIERPWPSRQLSIRRKLCFDYRLQSILVGPGPLPGVFYVSSLFALVVSLACLILDWQSPVAYGDFIRYPSIFLCISLFFVNSAMLTGKSLLRTLQIMSLNGRVTEFSFRFAPWGVYLRTDDEISENSQDHRLFMCLFYSSQLLAPFAIIPAAKWLFPEDSSPFYFLALYQFFWEMSPFRRTDFFDLLRSIILPHHLDLIAFIGTGVNPRQQKFMLICASLGVVWITSCIKVLESFARSMAACSAAPSAREQWFSALLPSSFLPCGWGSCFPPFTLLLRRARKSFWSALKIFAPA